MESVKVAIIGAGNIGYAHAVAISGGKVPGMHLSAVCDIDEGKLNISALELPGVKTYKDYRELLASNTAQAVIIATPHYLHPQIAADAFAAGLHVLTEKPAGVYSGAVRKMMAAAERSGRVFGIMFNQRTDPLFGRARDIVRSGQLGELKRLIWIATNWYRTQHYYDSGSWRATWRGEGGGVLLNQAPHNLDIWQWIFGMPSAIRADCRVAQYHRIEVEDEATIYAEYEGGATAVFITSTGEYPGTNRLEIAGDGGKLVLEDGILKLWKLRVPERKVCFESNKSFDKIPYEYEEIVPAEHEYVNGHIAILANFADAILHGAELIAPGSEGINELLISNAAYLSAWQGGQKIPLPPDDEVFYAELQQRINKSALKRETGATEKSGEYSERWRVSW